MDNSGPYGLLGDGHQVLETEEFALPRTAEFRAVSSEYLVPGRAGLIDIATTDPLALAVPVVAAVGAPGVRRDLVRLWAGTEYTSIIAATSWISPSATIGVGAIIAPQCVVGAGAVIGDHCLANIGCSISHETTIGDYVTLSPGVRVAGNCFIGDGVFLGVGSVVSNGVRIAAGTVVGAGAVVVADITSPGVYVGVPARRLRDQKEWLRDV